MKRLHVLTPGFVTPNGRAFLFPLVVHRRALRDAGIELHLRTAAGAGLTDCDALLVDSKYHKARWRKDAAGVLAELSDWAGRCRVVYCDTTDSSGWLQTEVLPVVQVYGKAQLLRDRGRYLQPLYGHRAFADYYHRRLGVRDREPEYSQPVKDAGLLEKLRLSWNSGLADYAPLGPLRMALYRRLPLPALLRYPSALAAPEDPRPNDISCRFGISYPRESVALQRRLIAERMAGRRDTRKLSRRRYFKELESSKAVVSPFGWGEITLKDFEVFLTGGLLVKPDMAHMETWPHLFRAGETMLTHAWDLSDFEAVLRRAVENDDERRAIAAQGQQEYLDHTTGRDAAERFAGQLVSLIA